MDSTYLTLKSLHIVGAVVFLGNIIVTGWWKVMADRTRDSRIIAFAQRQVTLTDFVFTAGGVALILATGSVIRLLVTWIIWAPGGSPGECGFLSHQV